MPHDPGRVAECRAWLQRARADLVAADRLLGGEDPLASVAVFHCQQAAEKALKAFLAWHDEPFRRTHNLEELGSHAARIDPSLTGLVARIVGLTEYAWRFRYPGEPAEPRLEEATTATLLAREAFEAVLSRLPTDTHP